MGQLVQKTSEIKLPESKALLKAKNLKKTPRLLHECFKAFWFLILICF